MLYIFTVLAGPRCLQLEYQITVFENDTYFFLSISYTGNDVLKTSLLYQRTDTANTWKDLALDIPSVEGLKVRYSMFHLTL